MPGLFSRLKPKDGKFKKKNAFNGLSEAPPQKPVDAWTRKTVDPEEVQELLRYGTEELKSRGLDHPFLMLPFRPTSNPSAVRTFVRHFFSQDPTISREALAQELRLIEPMVISGVLKWCWSRLQGGVVGWDAYELFKVGEYDSRMARDSFKTFIPISVENSARRQIIFDFFGLMAAVAAHGKTNGFGGRKLSRMAAWWAFEHRDTGNGFEGGYSAWLNAADATSHLFFAYLRSMSPEQNPTGIELLPRSLQKLLQETEYPPQRPELLMVQTKKVVMIVDTVSPTPFALLRRGNHFQYRDSDKELQAFSNYEDPVQALTEECRRVLKAISAANQSQASSSKHSTSLRDASWSRFEDIGFSNFLEEDDDDDESALAGRKLRQLQGLRTTPVSGGNGLARPTTPSWADFLSSGFIDDNQARPNLLIPSDKVLPPLSSQPRQQSSQSHRPRLMSDQALEPGELASIRVIDLDDAFWWVWMSSLAPEETPDRKSAFGRCAVIETQISGGRWLVMEEMVAGAVADPQEGAYIAEKKGFLYWTKRARTISGRKSSSRRLVDEGDKNAAESFNGSKTSIGPDAHARVQAKAAQLRATQGQEEQSFQAGQRRGRIDSDLLAEKTNSIFTLQPNIVGEASSAMKWVTKYDKGAIKDAYLANDSAGRGMVLSRTPSESANCHTSSNEVANDGVISPIVPPKDLPAALTWSQQPSALFLANGMAQDGPHLPAAGKTEQINPPPVKQPKAEYSLPTTPMEDIPVRVASPAFSDKITSSASGLSLDSMKQQKGFRKLFGRKNRTSRLPENASADMNYIAPHNAQTPEPAASMSALVDVVSAPSGQEALAGVAPKAQLVEPTYDSSVGDSVTQVYTNDAVEAKHSFANFHQGPLADQPAFILEHDEDDAVPPPIGLRSSSSQCLSNRASASSKEGLTQKTGPGIQDRWAQIRKNAADRAANRPIEDQSMTRYSKPANSDGDASGEETIESRVARIKARVAELTGNIEPPSTRQPNLVYQ